MAEVRQLWGGGRAGSAGTVLEKEPVQHATDGLEGFGKGGDPLQECVSLALGLGNMAVLAARALHLDEVKFFSYHTQIL